MIVHFNISPGAYHGRIEKEGEGPCEGINVAITVDDARNAWNAGTITNHNIAFWRLATEFDFDVAACLKWYKAQD